MTTSLMYLVEGLVAGLSIGAGAWCIRRKRWYVRGAIFLGFGLTLAFRTSPYLALYF